MLIEHTTKRHNGSIHTIAGVKYHFAPNDAGAHVAEVEDPAHIQRLLSIPSFTVYDPNAKPQPVAQAPVAPAATTATTAPIEGNEADDQQPTPLEEAPDEVLDELYMQAYGKKPHHKVKREKIIEMIRKAPVKEAE